MLTFSDDLIAEWRVIDREYSDDDIAGYMRVDGDAPRYAVVRRALLQHIDALAAARAEALWE